MEKYKDMKTVQSQNNDMTAQEFPDGPYGSAIEPDTPLSASDWHEGQDGAFPYSYENKRLHQGIPRAYPGSDPNTINQEKMDED